MCIIYLALVYCCARVWRGWRCSYICEGWGTRRSCVRLLRTLRTICSCSGKLATTRFAASTSSAFSMCITRCVEVCWSMEMKAMVKITDAVITRHVHFCETVLEQNVNMYNLYTCDTFIFSRHSDTPVSRNWIDTTDHRCCIVNSKFATTNQGRRLTTDIKVLCNSLWLTSL